MPEYYIAFGSPTPTPTVHVVNTQLFTSEWRQANNIGMYWKKLFPSAEAAMNAAISEEFRFNAIEFTL